MYVFRLGGNNVVVAPSVTRVVAVVPSKRSAFVCVWYRSSKLDIVVCCLVDCVVGCSGFECLVDSGVLSVCVVVSIV